ncbi:MAG: GMC family oxidoreductase N-terminal domain-containing protein, partial [Myxococcaceae bacterium]
MKVLQQFIFCSFFFSTYSLLAQPTEPCDVQMSYKNLDPGLVFDFVVIGSGPASGPIVRRLVDAGHRVILIEKGPYFLPPSPDASPIHNDSFDDTFQVKENANQWTAPSGLNISNHSIKQVDPQAYGIGANITIASRRREYPYRQVQGFGGQTLIYGGFAMRPSPGSFEKWPNITYEKMLPSFEKSELSSWACGSVSNAPEAHSCGNFSGFLSVLLHNESAYPKIAGVIPQFCALGNGTLWLDTTGNKSLDYNGNYPTRAFCGSPQLFHNRTTNSTNHTIYPRDSLQDTYLPCDYLKAKKNNLTICVNSKVDRLILDANQVTGAVLDGVGITVRGKCFILASGFRFSPQILMSSGIGDRANFSALGVETKVHLPDVGRHFHDEWGFT